MACLQYGRNTLRQQLKNVKTSAAIFHKCQGGDVHLHHPLFYAAQGLRYRKLQVILTTSIDKLGKAGETVRVAPGYFHNHLMPKLLAVPNIDKYRHLIEDQRKIYQCEEVEEVKVVPETKEDKMKEYQMAANRLDKTMLVLRKLVKKPLTKDDSGRTFIQEPVGKDKIVAEMAEIESRVSEGGASNDGIPNSSSQDEFEVDTSKKRKVMEPRAKCWTVFEKFIDKNGAHKARCVLTSEDWEKVRSMVKFLETFYLLTLKVSGSKYVTNNVHFVEIAELDLILKEMMQNEDPSLKKMAGLMREKFRKYWGEPDKMNKMIFISSVLDPRNKLDYVPFAIVDLFGKEVGDKLTTAVDTYMKALFDYYVKKSSKGSLSSPISSGNSSCISSVSAYGNFQKRGTLRTKQQFEKHKEVTGGTGSKSELGRYLAEDIEPDRDDFDILNWWKVNEPRFPILAEMARDVLAIPISSVASECAFSTGGRVLDPFRSSLTPKLVQSLICLQDWLRSEPIPINIEDDLEYLEQLELDMAHSGKESSIVDV